VGSAGTQDWHQSCGRVRAIVVATRRAMTGRRATLHFSATCSARPANNARPPVTDGTFPVPASVSRGQI